MHWQSLSDFLNMGGYAFYVWGSFGLTLVCVIGELITLRLRRQQAIRQLKQQRLMADLH
jgi:heme exporter protein D